MAFYSWASNLVPSDTNGVYDVFVHDLRLWITERVSLDSNGQEGNGDSKYTSISGDGRFIAFQSEARNLVVGDTNGHADVFVRDRLLGTTERVSVSSSGLQSNGDSTFPSISADGRLVAFQSRATNLVPGDGNGSADIFIHDRQTGVTELVSIATNGMQGNGDGDNPYLSTDGRYVVFYSEASNLVPGDTNGVGDVFVRDRLAGKTERVSVNSSGNEGNSSSYTGSISPDGRYVAFDSDASNLVPGDTNGLFDVFVRDRALGTTERVSLTNTGSQGYGWSGSPAISADGRFVAFSSTASLVNQDGNPYWDVYLRDRLLGGRTVRLSVPTFGTDQPNADSIGASISPDGRIIAFVSRATNIVAQNWNGFSGVYIRDVNSAHFTSYCDPGVGGTVSCPCGNPPSGPGHGCDNSSHTGGAILIASNVPGHSNSSIAYLSEDYLFLTAIGERPTALSILMQGTNAHHVGYLFGQGVRCISGNLKRLYTKTASGGSITFPDFQNPNDVQLSYRSAVLGDPIQPGQSRYYMVYYRDPIVLGGCPSTSTFNSTQSGAVVWYL